MARSKARDLGHPGQRELLAHVLAHERERSLHASTLARDGRTLDCALELSHDHAIRGNQLGDARGGLLGDRRAELVEVFGIELTGGKPRFREASEARFEMSSGGIERIPECSRTA